MSPFLGTTGHTYKAHLHDREGRRYIRSVGTRNRREAVLIETFLQRCRERRDWRTLDAIIAGEISAGEAYFASLDGSLVALLDAKAAAAVVEAEPDLDVLLGEWARVTRVPKYVVQVRRMIPEGERFPLSGFGRAAISAHLASLTCSEPTKNRHRVALSQFARWLVERDHLHANPVREVRGFRERDPRMVFYSRAETHAVLARLPYPLGVFEAFMAGAGLEWSAVVGLRRRDIDLVTREVAARGTKNRHRTRTVRVTDGFAWGVIEPHVALFTPDALLFAPIRPAAALAAHRAACLAAGVAVSTLHDWRHTYAVQALKDGLPPQTIKHQLGHSPHSTMLERVYSARIPAGDADYLATNLATSAPAARHKRGAK